MRTGKTYSAFIRELRGHSAQHQRKLITAYVAQRGGAIVSEYVAGKSGGDRDEWIRRIRSDEVAIVAGLFVIPEPAGKRLRPTADMTKALFALARRSGLIVCAQSGVTSADGEAWENLIGRDAVKVASGRQLSTKRAKVMAAKANAGRGPDVVAEWRQPSMRAEFARWSQHWRDPQFPSGVLALAAIPDDVRGNIGSVSTAYRIFGRRKPGDASAGGRPPKKSKKK